MILHVASAKYIEDYKIEISFNDGNFGVIDLGDEHFFSGPVFGPLKDKKIFSNFIIDPELNTIVWPNGADLAPEYLESKLLVHHKNP